MKNKNYVVNLGCRLNIYEGEIIKNHLKTNNLNNVTVINSCAVTEEAEKKVSYEIRKAKKNFPNNKIVVTGCAAQINPLKYKDLKDVDSVIGNTEKLEILTWKNIDQSKNLKVGNILEGVQQYLIQLKNLKENRELILKYNKVVTTAVLFVSFHLAEAIIEVYLLEK